MPPELTDPDGNLVDAAGADTEREFARAMAADATGEGPAAPPKRAAATAGDPAQPAARRGRPPKAERARVEGKGSKAPSGPLGDDQRAQGVKGIVQIGAGVCLLASRASARTARTPDGKTVRTDNPAFKADAITLASGADDLAAACVETAKADEKFGALLDKIAAVGPYGALITAVAGIGGQIVRNHRPGVALPGTVDPAELLAEAQKPAVKAAA